MSIKTSLRKDVIDGLAWDRKKGKPIYHRPQVGSGVCFKGGPGESINKRVGETMKQNGKTVVNPTDFRHTEFENPNVNMLLAFESRPAADNFYETRRLILTFNHNRRDKNRLGQYRVSYYATLEACNCCYYCKKPIKTQKAYIVDKEMLDARNDSWFADETPVDAIKKERDGGTKIRSIGGKPLRGIRYRPSKKAPNVEWGEIRSHFRFVEVKDDDGVVIKYRFVYIDGSGRRIEARKRANGTRYFVHVKNGVETEIIPQTSYRRKERCKCRRGSR